MSNLREIKSLENLETVIEMSISDQIKRVILKNISNIIK